MLEQKVAQVFPKVAQKVATPVSLKKQLFSKLPKKSPKHSDYRICCQEILKIAQSGHTGDI